MSLQNRSVGHLQLRYFTVAEKGHQLLLPFGDSAMEPCNGSATQWKCAMGSAQLNNYSTMQSHFAPGYRLYRYMYIGRLASGRVFNLAS